ncbi:hypothetical protein QYE76_046969 [Lolium multiflorum]|uniref:Uncharacterized protein n=1 Tax=Lolium multiflorum TaxID=4521 RepID=A0AAD8TPC4_LOLMU|nr:hypothetical protein QYE76_046969 [Lolium multiflorum]
MSLAGVDRLGLELIQRTTVVRRPHLARPTLTELRLPIPPAPLPHRGYIDIPSAVEKLVAQMMFDVLSMISLSMRSSSYEYTKSDEEFYMEEEEDIAMVLALHVHKNKCRSMAVPSSVGRC